MLAEQIVHLEVHVLSPPMPLLCKYMQVVLHWCGTFLCTPVSAVAGCLQKGDYMMMLVGILEVAFLVDTTSTALEDCNVPSAQQWPR
jgi:hypothetical protein